SNVRAAMNHPLRKRLFSLLFSFLGRDRTAICGSRLLLRLVVLATHRGRQTGFPTPHREIVLSSGEHGETTGPAPRLDLPALTACPARLTRSVMSACSAASRRAVDRRSQGAAARRRVASVLSFRAVREGVSLQQAAAPDGAVAQPLADGVEGPVQVG